MKKFLSYLVIALIVLVSCIEQDYYSQKAHSVKFISYTGPATKVQLPFTTGNISAILVFERESLSTNFGGTPVLATASAQGELIPQNNVSLAKGCYDIYSVSYNNSQNPSLCFENGFSGKLSNNIDYLWAAQKSVVINSEKVIVLNYKRLACKIILKVKADSSFKNLFIRGMKLAVPKTDSLYMNLSQGTIASSLTSDTLTSLPGTGIERSTIIVPKRGATDIEIELDANINGVNVTKKKYRGLLDIEFISGNCYEIELEIISDKIAVVSSSVSEWRLKNNLVIYSY